jgi:serine/tyrosine/threonine adenylyltransferase
MLRFDNQLIRTLAADPDLTCIPRQVAQAFSRVNATPVASPSVLAVSPDLAADLGLTEKDLYSAEFLAAMSGNGLLPGMQTWASNYGGHQFGRWAGQLGDGRALSLGEAIGPNGARLELQLKGAGPTPYSRFADGRAVLRSSLREFICSEAMHHLGVPTTRALCLVGTGESVERDMFYNGHRKDEPGAIICRVAPSFIRFGHFELPASRGDRVGLSAWIDLCIARDFAHLNNPDCTMERIRADWFISVCRSTARMVAHWMRVGFVHGVMNTDNMSILGLTIDYGPYGWLENFDPAWTPNTTDAQTRRYAFGRQAEIAHWNLGALAQALSLVIDDHHALKEGLREFGSEFNQVHQRMNTEKLGLGTWRAEDQRLLSELFGLMESTEIDFTLAFRALMALDRSAETVEVVWRLLKQASYAPSAFDGASDLWRQWLFSYQARISTTVPSERQSQMQGANPVYVPRNYLAQLAIDAAEQGDLQALHQWVTALKQPYIETASLAAYAAMRPAWAQNRAGCSMLSCSS